MGNITRWVVGKDREFSGAVVPIGRPIDRKRIRLVDESGANVADGEAGEVVVGSEYHFVGYWNRPDLTRQLLTADRERPSVGWYRTGDLARSLPGGELVHLGRRDLQLKVRGQRVEPAEVEHVIRMLDGIDDVVVTNQYLGPGRTRLVAYLETDGRTPFDRRRLRREIRLHLPAHMVPSAVATVPRLPTLPGGKIDRREVAERFAGKLDTRPDYIPPRTPVEETIAGIWGRVLKVERVGVEEDLFGDLGADSLAAVEIVASASEALGLDLPVSALYPGSTVGSLAAAISDGGWTPPDELALHREGERVPLFALCGAFGHALRLMLVGQRLPPEQPFWALQPPAMDWRNVRARTVEEMAEHYVERIRAIRPEGPYRLLGTSLGGIIAFEIACQLQAAEETVDLLVLVDTTAPGQSRAVGVGPRPWLPDGARNADPQIQAGIEVARQHVAAVDAYRPARFEGSITYLRCAEPAAGEAPDHHGRWSTRAADLDVVEVPGRHGQFHLEPQISAVVAAVESALDLL